MPDRKEKHIVISNGNIVHRFGLIFEFATVGIIVTDAEGTIINFNPHAEEQFGYSKGEVCGKNIELLIPPQYRAYHKKFRQNFYQHPGPRKANEGRDLAGLRKDGSEFPVEVSLSSYFIKNKLFVISFLIDITLRKQTQDMVLRQKKELEETSAEIKQLNAELEQKVENRTKILRETLAELEKSRLELSEALENEKHVGELKSRFVTMASHEFRTPLSTILSSAFLLEKYNQSNAENARLKHIQRIRNSVSGLKSILDDFLTMGRIEEGQIYDVKQEINDDEIRGIIDSVISDLEQRLKPGQQIEFACNAQFAIHADIEIIKNVMLNLLTNAIKFSGEDSTIKVRCSCTEDEIAISVEDQGIGIAEEDRKHLFERFFRAKSASNIQGTGLGLHIVARYLELINGRIDIQSQPEKGSCFTIYIPKSNNQMADMH